MVYIYLPAAYYYLNLGVTKENLLAAGFSAVPAVFLVCLSLLLDAIHNSLIFLKWLTTVKFTRKNVRRFLTVRLFIKPRQLCWAGFIAMLTTIVRLCVCLSVNKISQNYLTNQLHF